MTVSGACAPRSRKRVACFSSPPITAICEMMKDPVTGAPHTSHTTFDVPIIVVNAKAQFALAHGCLADVAPTLLDLMGLSKPEAMTGHSLVQSVTAESAA